MNGIAPPEETSWALESPYMCMLFLTNLRPGTTITTASNTYVTRLLAAKDEEKSVLLKTMLMDRHQAIQSVGVLYANNQTRKSAVKLLKALIEADKQRWGNVTGPVSADLMKFADEVLSPQDRREVMGPPIRIHGLYTPPGLS